MVSPLQIGKCTMISEKRIYNYYHRVLPYSCSRWLSKTDCPMASDNNHFFDVNAAVMRIGVNIGGLKSGTERTKRRKKRQLVFFPTAEWQSFV